LYYLSPIFILFDIKVYSGIDRNGDKVIFMTKDKNLKIVEKLFYTKLGGIYFAKKVLKDD